MNYKPSNPEKLKPQLSLLFGNMSASGHQHLDHDHRHPLPPAAKASSSCHQMIITCHPLSLSLSLLKPCHWYIPACSKPASAPSSLFSPIWNSLPITWSSSKLTIRTKSEKSQALWKVVEFRERWRSTAAAIFQAASAAVTPSISFKREAASKIVILKRKFINKLSSGPRIKFIFNLRWWWAI